MPVLQEILTQMGPCNEESQHDQEWEEGSHHGESHHSEHREEEHEREHERSHTPPGGIRYHWRGHGRDDFDLTQIEMMQELQRSKPPEFDGQGIGLKAKNWLVNMGHFFSLLPYGSNIEANCVIT